MKQISDLELKQIQQSILDKVHKFCQVHNIKYFIAAGTLLGAIRHKGYIPWDDDIDIYLLREDYNRLEEIFNQTPPEYLRFLTLKTNKEYDFAFGKIEDTRTQLNEHASIYQCGVNIDVFPIDAVPSDNKKRKKLFSQLKMSEALLALKMVPMKFQRGFFKNLILLLGKTLLCCISVRNLAQKRNSLIEDFSFDSDQVADLSTFAFRKVFPRELFKETCMVEFEGKFYMTVKNWDGFLRLKFGDYLKLPPEDQRISHHGFEAFWKDDYEEVTAN